MARDAYIEKTRESRFREAARISSETCPSAAFAEGADDGGSAAGAAAGADPAAREAPAPAAMAAAARRMAVRIEGSAGFMKSFSVPGRPERQSPPVSAWPASDCRRRSPVREPLSDTPNR